MSSLMRSGRLNMERGGESGGLASRLGEQLVEQHPGDHVEGLENASPLTAELAKEGTWMSRLLRRKSR